MPFLFLGAVSGDSNALQNYQTSLTNTDYHQFRAAKQSLFPFVANACRHLTVSLDDALMHVEPREAHALAALKSPAFLSIVDTIVSGIIGCELPVDPSALCLLSDVALLQLTLTLHLVGFNEYTASL